MVPLSFLIPRYRAASIAVLRFDHMRPESTWGSPNTPRAACIGKCPCIGRHELPIVTRGVQLELQHAKNADATHLAMALDVSPNATSALKSSAVLSFLVSG